ncbi:MAG: hypothetical protein OIF56_00400 [Cohaesibacter sp.]|nr:hypothetical protein [Cohaesibacter sp.]MCV6601455.1 hypothetical protein [Cohaesibacter sp.]
MSFSRLLARLMMVPLGLFCAILATGIFLAFALLTLDPHYGTDPQLHSIFALFSGVVMAAMIGPFSVTPTLAFLLMAELLSWRSLYIYLGFGLTLSLFAFHVPTEAKDQMATDLDIRAMASGLVGGFVYWMIAGRGAGIVKRDANNKPLAL